MDLFDWSQLPDYFGTVEFSASLENVLLENNDTASLGWTDYSTPRVSMMTYPEPRQILNRQQQFFNQTVVPTECSGSSFSSTDGSCRCQDGGESAQNDVLDEDETIASRSKGRPRTPLQDGSDPGLSRIQVFQ